MVKSWERNKAQGWEMVGSIIGVVRKAGSKFGFKLCRGFPETFPTLGVGNVSRDN